jgi:L-fucose isomerase-like protein
MSFLRVKLEKIMFGIIVGNRVVFPSGLAKQGRIEIIETMNELGYDYVILGEKDTQFGVVESYADAKKCADIFKANREKINGIVVILPNFEDENFLFFN